MPFSLPLHSYMIFLFSVILIKGFSCGELLCNTTLILIDRCFISHWTLPPSSDYLSAILYDKVSSLSFSILLRMISRLIPWKWFVGFLSSLRFFWFIVSWWLTPSTRIPDLLKNFWYFIYLSERGFTGFSLVWICFFLLFVCDFIITDHLIFVNTFFHLFFCFFNF